MEWLSNKQKSALRALKNEQINLQLEIIASNLKGVFTAAISKEGVSVQDIFDAYFKDSEKQMRPT